jgi:hypothetical protein
MKLRLRHVGRDCDLFATDGRLAAAEGVADGLGSVVGRWRWLFGGAVAFGVQDNVPAWAQAGGSGGQARFGESQMQQAALARAHGVEGVGLAGAANALDGSLGCETQLLLTKHFEILGVEGDAVVVFVLEAEDFSGGVLEREEEFAVTGGEERRVRAGEFDFDFGVGGWLDFSCSVAWLRFVIADEHVELQVQSTGFYQGLEEVLDFFQSRIRVLHVVFFGVTSIRLLLVCVLITQKQTKKAEVCGLRSLFCDP